MLLHVAVAFCLSLGSGCCGFRAVQEMQLKTTGIPASESRTDIRARTAIFLDLIDDPHAVDIPDGDEETDDDITPDGVGPSGGAGGSGGSAAAVVRINAAWFQTVKAYPIQE